MGDGGNWFHAETDIYTNSLSGVQWEQTCHGSTSSYQFHGILTCPAEAVAATPASSKSHSQAEKRRRDRINAQLANLRKVIPMSEKMDKAALLATTVDHIKDLKTKTKEISKLLSVPSDSDEVTVESCITQEADINETTATNKNSILFNVTFCCEDRPELFQELTSAFKGLKLSIVDGDIACLGGRTRARLILGVEKDGENHSFCANNIKQSLKAVLGRIVSSSAATNFRVTTRRQRFLLESSGHQAHHQHQQQKMLYPGQY